MANELSMRQKIREILFRYRATPLINGKTPAEQYLQRQIRIQLDALKPIKFQKTTVPTQPARQLSVGERVQARYYGNNKKQWKLGTFKRKFDQLHYLIELDDGYKFKRHIDQLRRTEIQPRKSVSFAPETNDEPDPNTRRQRPTIEDLVQIPVNQPECSDHQADVDVSEPEAVQFEISDLCVDQTDCVDRHRDYRIISQSKLQC